MGEIQWGLLDPNSFQRGYQSSEGMIDKITNSFKQSAQDNALRQYAMNPNDPAAINALAQGDPRFAIQVRQQQGQAQQQKHDRDTKLIATLARDANDPASFDAAVDQVVSMGYPEAAQFKGKFSPAVRSALMAAGGIKDEVASGPNIQKEVDYYRSIGRPELADQLLQHHAEGPPIMVDNGDGTKTLYPRAALSGAQQGAAPPPPPGFVLDGGPTPQASGGFP